MSITINASTMNVDGETFVTVIVPGVAPLVANSQHPNFARIQALISGDLTVDTSDDVADLFDVSIAVERRFSIADRSVSSRVKVHAGQILFDAEGNGDYVPVHDALTKQILAFMEQDVDDWKPLVRFMEKCYLNPSEHSRTQMYEWLNRYDFTITTSGKILAYKGCQYMEGREDGVVYSTRSGPAIVDGEPINDYVPNRPGSIIQMERSRVQHDPSNGCSVGLHVGTYDYALGYARNGKLLEVHVDPQHVVSVPTDCGAQKMRVAEYEVIDVIEARVTDAVRQTESHDDYVVEDDPEYVVDPIPTVAETRQPVSATDADLQVGTVVRAIPSLNTAGRIPSGEQVITDVMRFPTLTNMDCWSVDGGQRHFHARRVEVVRQPTPAPAEPTPAPTETTVGTSAAPSPLDGWIEQQRRNNAPAVSPRTPGAVRDENGRWVAGRPGSRRDPRTGRFSG